MPNLTSLNDVIELTIPSSTEYLGVVRLLISGVAERMNFDVDAIEDIKIAISEACTNSVLHAYDEDISNTLNLKVIRKENELEVVVKDFGKGFDLAILEENKLDEKIQEGVLSGLGLGFTFIKSLMDEVDIQSTQSEGSTITMIKKLPR